MGTVCGPSPVTLDLMVVIISCREDTSTIQLHTPRFSTVLYAVASLSVVAAYGTILFLPPLEFFLASAEPEVPTVTIVNWECADGSSGAD